MATFPTQDSTDFAAALQNRIGQQTIQAKRCQQQCKTGKCGDQLDGHVAGSQLIGDQLLHRPLESGRLGDNFIFC
jgi:hypothetical protein